MCLEYHARVEILLAFYSSWHSILFFTIEERENRAKTAPFLSAWKKEMKENNKSFHYFKRFILQTNYARMAKFIWRLCYFPQKLTMQYRLSRPKYALHSIVSTKNKISKSYFANTSPFDKHSYIKYQTLCRRNAKLCPYQFHVEFTHTGNYKSLFCGNPI